MSQDDAFIRAALNLQNEKLEKQNKELSDFSLNGLSLSNDIIEKDDFDEISSLNSIDFQITPIKSPSLNSLGLKEIDTSLREISSLDNESMIYNPNCILDSYNNKTNPTCTFKDDLDTLDLTCINTQDMLFQSPKETVYAHKQINQYIPENNYINKKENEFMHNSPELTILSKSKSQNEEDESFSLIRRADNFLNESADGFKKKDVLSRKSTEFKEKNESKEDFLSQAISTLRKNNRKINSPTSHKKTDFDSPIKPEQLINNLELNKKLNRNNFELTNKLIRNNSEFPINYSEQLINNPPDFYNYSQFNQEELLDDNIFYFNKLNEQNKNINPERIKQLLFCLNNVFKIERFRENQLQIINAILDNKDVFVLMPTGGGKSLCYQLPSLIDDRVTIIISPLIALIKDQVEALLKLKIPAIAFYGTMNKKDKDTCFIMLEEWVSKIGIVKIFYLTPELLNSSSKINSILSKIKKRFIIDEVHCLSHWGNDFRPDYLNLDLKQFNSPIACLTATATQKVIEDICINLKIHPQMFKQSFKRTNLIYKIIDKSTLTKGTMKAGVIQDVVSFISIYYKNCSGIIYCTSKKECEELSALLYKYDLKALFYHAGLTKKERNIIQSEWSNNNMIMIATIAFGMGINKPDVRYVIHYSIPKNLDSYYQETGRAGRDGLKAECIMYYHYSDRIKIYKMTGSKEVDLVVAYCETKECRTKHLLKYFNEESEDCLQCDNCLKPKNVNILSDKNILIDLLKKEKEISFTNFTLKLKGVIKKSQKCIEKLIRDCIKENILREKVVIKGKNKHIYLELI